MHPLRSITKSALSQVKKVPGKDRQYKDHRVALKEGNEIAHTVTTPGFKRIVQDIQNEVAKITESWMNSKPEEREELRLRALIYKEVLQKFDSYLTKREVARKAIRRKNTDLDPQE